MGVAVAVWVAVKVAVVLCGVCNSLGCRLPPCHRKKPISTGVCVWGQKIFFWVAVVAVAVSGCLIIAVAVDKHNALAGVPVVPRCGVPLGLLFITPARVAVHSRALLRMPCERTVQLQ